MKRAPTLEHVVMAVFMVALAASVAQPIDDNSMLVHLRTGMDMFDSGAIPRTDPYSFTAVGEPWVVQSWFASWVYGALHALGGYHLVIVLQVLLAAATGWVMALLARSGSIVRTAVACVAPFAIAWLTWSQRPLLFGVLCFALTVYVVLREKSFWWLLPIVWLWVNTHGSFVMGVAWLTALIVGRAIDERGVPKPTLKYLAGFGAGLLLACVSPLGPKLLLFFTRAVGEKAESFNAISEWASPNFQTLAGTGVLVGLAVLVTAGFHKKLPWAHIVPVVGLLGASLYSSRHLTLLTVAACPLLGYALREEKHQKATKSEARVAAVATVLVALSAVLVVTKVFTGPQMALERYNTAALQTLGHQGPGPQRLLTTQLDACYLIWRDGKEARVFMDDRADMYPVPVATDYRHLLKGDAQPQPILDRYRIDTVLWQKDLPLSQTLMVDPRWRVVWTNSEAVALTRA